MSDSFELLQDDDLAKIGISSLGAKLIRWIHSVLLKLGFDGLASGLIMKLILDVNAVEAKEIPDHASLHRGECWIITLEELPMYLSQGWVEADMDDDPGEGAVGVYAPRI